MRGRADGRLCVFFNEVPGRAPVSVFSGVCRVLPCSRHT